jgi:hypothetical protein
VNDEPPNDALGASRRRPCEDGGGHGAADDGGSIRTRGSGVEHGRS